MCIRDRIRVGAIKESVGNISCRESFPKTHVRYWHPLGCRAIELEKPLQGEVWSHRRTWVVDGVLMYPSNEVLVPGVPQRVYPTKERYYRRRKKMPWISGFSFFFFPWKRNACTVRTRSFFSCALLNFLIFENYSPCCSLIPDLNFKKKSKIRKKKKNVL